MPNRPKSPAHNTSRPHYCSCGKVVKGPLAKASHHRACSGYWLTWQEVRAYLGRTE